jgi:hypothetical protein
MVNHGQNDQKKIIPESFKWALYSGRGAGNIAQTMAQIMIVQNDGAVGTDGQ